ncbi:ABC transporter permease [Chitinimonas sp. BJYL2]|uniref:ABC transporter permease n=1 Tax=Chitinimonas sp. BJYL2 TaxID=2976696 RepID=UPI0022B30CCC|nr:ABC transporter permease subunit [Chitinimonas sp. BJYL2]
MEEYVWTILAGSTMTLKVALGSLTVAVILGLLGATAKLSANKLLNWAAGFYSTAIRGVPDLVWMLLLFYGGQTLLNMGVESLWEWARLEGNESIVARFEAMGLPEFLEIDPFVAGVLTIGFIYGAYMTETFRGAIIAIPKGQMEAGYAYGMSGMRVFFRITVPQMIRLALPSFTNNWLVLIKATALVSVIGLADMTRLAREAAAAARDITPFAPMLFFLLISLIYLAFTTISLVVLKQLDKKFSMGVRRGEF